MIPNHHNGITRCNNHHRFGVNCVIRWSKNWKRRPLPCLAGKLTGQLCQVCKAVCPILMEWLEDSCLSGIRVSLSKSMGVAATQCTPGVGHRSAPGGTYACHGCTPKGCGDAKRLSLHWWKCLPCQNLKAESKQHKKHQYKEIGWRLVSEKENYSWEGPMA